MNEMTRVSSFGGSCKRQRALMAWMGSGNVFDTLVPLAAVLKRSTRVLYSRMKCSYTLSSAGLFFFVSLNVTDVTSAQAVITFSG